GAPTNAATPRWAGPTACNLPDGTFAVLCSFVSQTGDRPFGYVAAVNGETGLPLWVFRATPFDALGPGANAEVRDISTPVVHRGWVYFACSEYDPDLVPAPGWEADGAYGRAWCIDAQTGGGTVAPPPWFNEYGVWSFPDPDLDQDGQIAPADTDESERPGLLPPLAEPEWVAGVYPQDPSMAGRPRQLPPDPGLVPAVTTSTRGARDRTEAVMLLGTPVSTRYDVAGNAIRIARSNLGLPFQSKGTGNERYGGRDIALVPTPGRVVGGAMQWFLNRNYYRLVMNFDVANATDISEIRRHDDNSYSITGGWQLENPGPTGSRIVIIDPDRARYLLAAYLGGSIVDATSRVIGTNVDVVFAAPPPDPQLEWLRGPVPWQSGYWREERRIAPAAVRNEKLFAVTTIPDPSPSASGPTPASRTARLVSQDLRIGAREWQFNPVTAAPEFLGVPAPQGKGKSAPAVGHDTVVTTMTLAPQAGAGPSKTCVFGTGLTPLLTVSLCAKPSVPNHYKIAASVPNPGDPNPDHRQPVTIRLLRNGAVIDSYQYEVDYDQATVSYH
ncbi:MAG: hypothetical protein J7M26_06085, partial [Armatimonadetes bacterium]|nr:hypothetical protein [Armatimonadota bacterium]